MTRSEELSLKAYPISPSCLSESNGDGDRNYPRRLAFIEGYRQAEKNLALTWEDIERIEHYCEQVNREHNMGTFRGTPYGKSFYKEVARRFNVMKEEKK